MTEQKDYSAWPGTDDEKYNFLQAIARQCECITDSGRITEVCKPHMLLSPTRDNHAYWEHLVYGKRLWGSMGKQFRLEEFGPQKAVERGAPYKMRW